MSPAQPPVGAPPRGSSTKPHLPARGPSRARPATVAVLTSLCSCVPPGQLRSVTPLSHGSITESHETHSPVEELETRPPAARPPYLVASTLPVRTLVGDWEAADTLLLAFDESWMDALQELFNAVEDDSELFLLAAPEQIASEPFQEWIQPLRDVNVLPIAVDTPWLRDYGPLRVRSEGTTYWLDTDYAPDRPLDDAVPERLSELFHVPWERPGLPLDGGGVISNGAGLCAMTGRSLDELGLALEDPEVSDNLLHTLGCRVLARVPALPEEATGHVDMIAQFLDPTTIAVATPGPNSTLEERQALTGALVALHRAASVIQMAPRFVSLPIVRKEDTYFSYVNGFRTRNHYLVPSYSEVPRSIEARAHFRLARALPGVKVVPIPADVMIESGGAVHCLTIGLESPSRAGSKKSRARARRRQPSQRPRSRS